MSNQLLRRGSKRRPSLVGSALATVLLFAAGCSSGSADTENLGSSQLAAYQNEKTIYEFFVGKGLKNFQAAGVVGNLIQESGLDPTIHQYNNGPGRGLAQWSAGARWDTTDGDNVKDYAAEHGNQDVYSLSLQLDFIWYELTTFDDYGLAPLKASTTVEQATQVFEDEFEGCVYANYPVCALPQRITNAKAILKTYGDTVVGGGGSGGGGGGGTGGGGGGGSSAGGGGAGGAAGGTTGVGGTGGAGGTSSAGGGSGGSASGGATAGASGSTSTGGISSTGGASGGSTAAGGSGAPSGGAGGKPFVGYTNGDDAGGCSVTSRPASSASAWGALLFAALCFGRRRAKAR